MGQAFYDGTNITRGKSVKTELQFRIECTTPRANLHRITLSTRTNTVGRSRQADLLIGFLIDNQCKLRRMLPRRGPLAGNRLGHCQL